MKTKLLFLLALLVLNSGIATASPLGTAFTYQGRLSSGTNAANGNYDLKFTIYDALSSGSVVAGPLTNAAIGVSNGLFTTTLDFGASVFTGYARWLEMGVRTNGSSAFATLNPRQQLAPTPYAIFANGASNLSGTLPAAQLSGTVGNSQLAAGAVTAVKLDPTIGVWTKSGSNISFIAGNVGIGTANPQSALHVNGSVQLDKSGTALGRLILNTVSRNDPGRYGIQFKNNTMAPFLGDDTQPTIFGFMTGWSNQRTNAAAIRAYGKAANSWGTCLEITHNGTNGVINTDVGHLLLAPAGNVGIGTPAPTAKLEVNTSYGGTGIMGKHTTTGNYGYLGGGQYGVYGYGSSNSAGVYGVGSTSPGVSGVSSYSSGVSGTSVNGHGVHGENNTSGFYGRLGNIDSGVYGYGSCGVYGIGSTFGVVGFGQNGQSYDFYAAGSGVNYGPFTGGHEVKLSDDFPADARVGMIVSVTGKTEVRRDDVGNITISSTLPTVKLCKVSNDKAVFGVFVAETPLPQDHWYKAKEGERFATVNALGEGRVWVCNIDGEVQVGDYITTSAVPGYGQKQSDDLLRSCTLGKATESVDWDSVTETIEFGGRTYKVYLIAVVYTSA